ncbi:MAG TPA: antitoxin Xre-like helix-turn-helix domain-containing protein [Hanamia sp.]|nr:antitoxin Xre-like helix-turn-helix domain-containing protein [Hanamia sp.]
MPVIAINNKNSVKHRFKTLDVSNLNAIVSAARKGIKTKVFYDFAETIKMPEKNLAAVINISAKTIGNYKNEERLLDPIYSEHLLKLIRLYEKGEELFGDVNEFNYWLKKPFWNKKITPNDLINTTGGVDLILEELDKLAQGYPI